MPNRYINADLVEFKGLAEPGEGDAEGPEAWKFSGLLSVYGNVDGHGDVVVPGAFTKALSTKSVVPLLWQHDMDNPIGYGLLTDTPKGLYIDGELAPDTLRAKDARAMMRMGVKLGAPFGLSMGYITVKADREVKDYPGARRRLTEVKVMEGSPVTFPSNDLSRVTDAKDAPEGVAMTPENMDALLKAATLTRADFRSHKHADLPDLDSASAAHRAMERVLSEASGVKAALSFGEIEDAVRAAIVDVELSALSEDDRREKWIWLRAIWSDRAVYTLDGQNWQRTYTLVGTEVQLGARVEVQQAWVPVDAPKSAEPEEKSEEDMSGVLDALRGFSAKFAAPQAA